MARSKPTPWEEFAVGKPSDHENWTNKDCQPFTEITHVTHVDLAIEIHRTGVFRPRLVYDKSKLNDERILVNWLSPTHRGDGSRYGNVAYVFSWDDLIHGMNYYWVEAIRDYNPTACRILVTPKRYSNHSELIEYDPTVGNGPWWQRCGDNSHWWNGDYCLEIMFEREIPLSKVARIEFQLHSPRFCCLNRTHPKTCPDLGSKDSEGGALFVASLACREIALGETLLTEAADGGREPSIRLIATWNRLRQDLEKKAEESKLVSAAVSTVNRALARAVLGTYARRNDADMLALVSLFPSKASLMASCADVVNTVFSLEGDNAFPSAADNI